MGIEEELWNCSSRLIIGLIGSGFIFAWISELFFSLVALLVEYIKNKIKVSKGDKNNNV